MARGVVRDYRVWYAVLTQFPAGKPSALISWSHPRYPNVYRQAAIVRRIDGRSGGAIINKGQPSRVAMREHIDSVARFPLSDILNQLQPVLSDHPAMLRVFFSNRIGCAPSKSHLFVSSFSIGHAS